jgi:predicted ATPase
MRLRDLKSFSDSKSIKLRSLNLLIGANNAGKSTFLSAIELFFRSMRGGGLGGPLAFSAMPSFTSFDSSLRRHWNRNSQRPSKILLNYEWSLMAKGAEFVRDYEFECASQGSDDTIVVSKANYGLGPKSPPISATLEINPESGRVAYLLKSGKKEARAEDEWFHQLMPIDAMRLSGQREHLFYAGRITDLEVVNPYRPVPRSFYVLDDPNLATEDRGILTYLIRLWASRDGEDKKVQQRINASLAKLGLTQHFEVIQVSKRIGPKVVEIRVAPTSSRQKVTIADAGFGLSQFLPLAVYDARLSEGTLIAYQPEVHLHPFAQSRLADVFVDSLSRGNQIFVETHSVDLILRLQAKIAEGSVKPEDVCVLCFENNGGKSEVYQMEFDDSGKPSKPWPDGFLDTSLKLARELTSARIQRLQSSSGS